MLPSRLLLRLLSRSNVVRRVVEVSFPSIRPVFDILGESGRSGVSRDEALVRWDGEGSSFVRGGGSAVEEEGVSEVDGEAGR